MRFTDDPSLLRETQDDFVLSQDVLEDDSVDKENLPPSAEPKNIRCPPKRKNPTRLEKMEQNVEKILMFMERWKYEENISVPEKQILEIGEFLFNSDPVYAFDNDSIEDSGCLPSLAEISNVLNIDETLPGMETSTIDLSKIATPSNQSPITPTVQRSVPAGLLKSASQSTPAIPSTQQSTPVSYSTPSAQSPAPIPVNLFDEVFTKSSSMSNYAKNLVFSVLKAELLNANCTGACNKEALEKDPRLGQIREMTFKKHGAVDSKIAWCAC